jgi:outer membrane lipoprotein-sorting protein
VAQTAKEVLDKTASIVAAKSGAKASFSIKGDGFFTGGTIAIKGRKFQATTAQATVWFDGKTMWTYMKKSDEVSVTTPNDSQLQKINPYNFINLYKKGYNTTMSTSASDYNVHLTAQGSNNIKELFITIDKKTYHPKQVKMLQGNKWTTFDISELKTQSLNDGMFTFNSKDFPSAEVIDLR